MSLLSLNTVPEVLALVTKKIINKHVRKIEKIIFW